MISGLNLFTEQGWRFEWDSQHGATPNAVNILRTKQFRDTRIERAKAVCRHQTFNLLFDKGYRQALSQWVAGGLLQEETKTRRNVDVT